MRTKVKPRLNWREHHVPTWGTEEVRYDTCTICRQPHRWLRYRAWQSRISIAGCEQEVVKQGWLCRACRHFFASHIKEV